jgi:CsoR family transcriptional regulator, copper-sensing transcriptional repressor
VDSHLKKNSALQARVRRIEGQVKAIGRMVEEGKPCYDVMVQVAAARAAIAKVGTIVLQDHLENCVAAAIERGTGREAIDEVIEVLDRFVR